MTRTARICSRTIRIGHFSSRTIEGGTPTQLAEYFVKHLSFVGGLSAQHNKCTSYVHTHGYGSFFLLLILKFYACPIMVGRNAPQFVEKTIAPI